MTSNRDVMANEPNLSFSHVAPAIAAPQVVSAPEAVDTSSSSKMVLGGDTQQVEAAPAFAPLSGLQPASLSDFPARWTRIKTTVVSAADTPFDGYMTSLVDTFLVYDLLLANPALAEKTKFYQLFRGDVELMGIVSIPGNASGAYAVFARPYATEQPAMGVGSGMTGISGGIHPEDCLAYEQSTLLVAAASSNIHFHLPFWCLMDANRTSSASPLGDWEVVVNCLSPLRTAVAGGVTTGQIQWYARLVESVEFMVPRYQGKKKTLVDTAKEWKQNKTISKTAGVIKSAADSLGAIPFLGPVAATVSGAAATVGAIADFFGFTRENPPVEIAGVFSTSVQNQALVDGADRCQVAGFSVRNHISIAPDVSGGEALDPLSFESMSQRWKAIKAMTWTSANVADDVLGTVYVHPGYGIDLGAGAIACSAAGYCAIPFEYWRADAEFLFVVPASSLHRGALQVTYIPNDSTAPAGGISVTNTTQNAVLDVSSASAYHLEVGYCARQPMLPMRYFMDGMAIVPVNAGNGVLQLKVVNPLVSQNPTDSLNITVFVRFKNVQFAVPRVNIDMEDELHSGLVAYPWEDGVTFQGRAEGTGADSDMIEEFPLVALPGPYPVDAVVAGEDIRSLRALAQRPSRLALPDANVAVIGFGGMQVFGAPSRRTTTAALALMPFITAAASERIRVIPESDTWVGCASMTTSTTTDPLTMVNAIPAHMPMTFSGPQRGAEFALPYYFPTRSRGCRGNGGVGSQPVLNNTNLQNAGRVAVLNVRGTTPKFRAYYSLGDDLRVGPFFRIPRVVLSQVVPTSPGWFV